MENEKLIEKCLKGFFKAISSEINVAKKKKEDVIKKRFESFFIFLVYEKEDPLKIIEKFKINYYIEYQDVLYYTLSILR
jgi:hypothetical protein